MAILISWGDNKPNEELAKLMCAKASSYHFIRGTVRLEYGHRWAKPGETPASYDQPCWYIRDDSSPGPDSRGLEGCQALLEGLQNGWDLHAKLFPIPEPKTRKAKQNV